MKTDTDRRPDETHEDILREDRHELGDGTRPFVSVAIFSDMMRALKEDDAADC